MKLPLVSIIIPTYNRAHLIGETLDSVIAQTYTNWECIVVDDGSVDGTDILLGKYCAKDIRFQYYQRPSDRPKGANACRNYGFKLSKGEYVNWFDSDDLMLPNFIYKKTFNILNNNKLDFIISKCINFNEDGTTIELEIYRDIESYQLNAENFILNKVGWITQDMLIKKSTINGVLYDEFLNSGQEYNFIVKLLSFNKIKGRFINEILSKRRVHNESIQARIHINEINALQQKLISQIKTFLAVKNTLNKKIINKYLSTWLTFYKKIIQNHNRPPYLISFFKLYINERGLMKSVGLFFYFALLFFGKESYRIKEWMK